MLEILIDVESTGLCRGSDVAEGHSIIELCAIVLEGTFLREMWHSYFDPGRGIDPGATAIHGITNDMVKGEPRFANKADSLLRFINGSNLIAHNAPFDRRFINAELERCSRPARPSTDHVANSWIDTLAIARKRVPGKKHTLDALCKHYGISLAARRLHGATLDCKLLAEVYMHLEGRREQLALDVHHERIWFPGGESASLMPNNVPHPGPRPTSLPSRLTEKEKITHRALMDELEPARVNSAETRQLMAQVRAEIQEEQEEDYAPHPMPFERSAPLRQPSRNHVQAKSEIRSRGLRNRK